MVPAESYCAYKYSLPCTEDADCGEGFDCAAQEMVSCPGSGPVGMGGGTDPGMGTAMTAVDAGAVDAGAEAPMMGDCTTTLSDVKYCRVIAVMCETDADCTIDGWTCQDIGGVSAGCAVTEPPTMVDPPSGSGGATSTDPTRPAPAIDGGAPTPYDDCAMDPIPVIKQCMPAGYGYFASAGGVSMDDSGGVTLGTPEAPNTSGGTPQTGGNPGDVNSGAESSSGSSDSGGCSFSGTPTSGFAGFAGMFLGLAALVARRRRQ
jgi:MYXO-CTERM domain-containing protein